MLLGFTPSRLMTETCATPLLQKPCNSILLRL